MKIKQKIIIGCVGLTIILFAAGFAVWTHFNPGYCQVCDRGACRALTFGLKTKWGIPTRTCCPRCGLTYMFNVPGSNATFATDFNTGKRIEAEKAFYVDGSDVRMCHKHEAVRDEIGGSSAFTKFDRCLPSLIAFSSEDEARKFQKENGGIVRTLEEFQPVIEKNRISKG